jgi:hypothetical protein
MSTNRLTGAACSRPENIGLPWTSENASALARARMSRVCAACPVAAACAVEVATTETTAGFWAGADRTMWRDTAPTTGQPVQGTLPLDLPSLAVEPSEVAA